jgi:hypothetical protein
MPGMPDAIGQASEKTFDLGGKDAVGPVAGRAQPPDRPGRSGRGELRCTRWPIVREHSSYRGSARVRERWYA